MSGDLNQALTFAVAIAAAIDASWDRKARTPLIDFFERQKTDRWMIYSDYALGISGRPHDVFAFTFAPAGRHLGSLLPAIEMAARVDFKEIKSISEAMARLLSDDRLFSVLFVVDSSRVVLKDLATVRRSLDLNISSLTPCDFLTKLKALRKKADANSFNIHLLEDMVLASSFAAFLSYLACFHQQARSIGWFSDRDPIIEGYGTVAHNFYSTALGDLKKLIPIGYPGPEIIGVSAASSVWCDPYIRVSDYRAGAVSAWDPKTNTLPSEPPKYGQMWQRGIAANQNVVVIRFHSQLVEGRAQFSAERIDLSHSIRPVTPSSPTE